MSTPEIKHRWTALMWATREGRIGIVSTLIRAGGKVNATNNDGLTALMLVAYVGYIQTANDLIKAGAEVNAKDNYGGNALMAATSKGYTQIADILIKAGTKKTLRIFLAKPPSIMHAEMKSSKAQTLSNA